MGDSYVRNVYISKYDAVLPQATCRNFSSLNYFMSSTLRTGVRWSNGGGRESALKLTECSSHTTYSLLCTVSQLHFRRPRSCESGNRVPLHSAESLKETVKHLANISSLCLRTFSSPLSLLLLLVVLVLLLGDSFVVSY